MTTTTLTAGHTRAGHDTGGPLLPDVLRSEWTKLRSVRSTYWSLLATMASAIGVAALFASVFVNRYAGLSAVEKATFNPVEASLNGLFIAQLAIGVLGVLVITSEYGTGMIRSTLAAVPQRGTVLAAKAAIFGAVSLVVGLVSSFAAFFVAQSIFTGKGIEAHLGDPGVLRSLTGAGIYLALIGLLALAIGALIRHSAGAIAALFGLIFVLPGLVQALPSSWSNAIAKYLPSNAGQAVFRTATGHSSLSPWVGLGMLGVYVGIALAVATVTIKRRDA